MVMLIAWLADLHLDFLAKEDVEEFCMKLRSEDPRAVLGGVIRDRLPL